MVLTKELIAYSGDAFTIEWYFDEHQRSAALDYYNQLTINERILILKLFKRIGDVSEIHDKTKFRFEGDKIYAFKPQPIVFFVFSTRAKKSS